MKSRLILAGDVEAGVSQRSRGGLTTAAEILTCVVVGLSYLTHHCATSAVRLQYAFPVVMQI